MTDIHTDTSKMEGFLKKLISRLNTLKIIFMLTFVAISVVFLVFSVVLNKKGKERLEEVYQLRKEHDRFEALQFELQKALTDSYINALQYLSEQNDIYLYQSVTAISEINRAYNELFVISRSIDENLIPNALAIKNAIYVYERELLAQMADPRFFETVEIHPIITDLDTLEQDMSLLMDFEAEDEGMDEGLFDEEFAAEEPAMMDEPMVAEEPVNKQKNHAISKLKEKSNRIETQLFELNVLLSGTLDKVTQREIEKGVARKWLLMVFLLGLIVLFVVSYRLVKKKWLYKIDQLSAQLKIVSTGELPEKLPLQADEFDNVVKNGNAIIDYMDDASKFAIKIGEGDFGYEFSPKCENDELGNALIQMRGRLLEVANEDKVRNWINEGQAKFGDILRNAGNDIEKLGDSVISNLVEYLGANQGMLYVKEETPDGHVRLKLLSAYAYNRKKHMNRAIEVGEGMVGQVYKENKSVLLKEVKSDHFNIVTGLGESKPSSVLIVPLKDESDIEGVVEISSLAIFKEYQVNFVEKIGESIASSIKSGKINDTTKQLLAEMQTREEEMRAQEEELKQNMEELSATQEQMERLRQEDDLRKNELMAKRTTLYQVLNACGSLIYVKDDHGKYVYVNKLYADSVGKEVDEIIGKTDDKVVGNDLAMFRSELEEKVLEENVALSETEEFQGAKRILSLSPFLISHLNKPGVIGVIKL